MKEYQVQSLMLMQCIEKCLMKKNCKPENYENKYGALNKQGLFNTQKKPIGKGAKRLKNIAKQQKGWSID